MVHRSKGPQFWKDLGNYPDPSTTSMHRWAAEFLLRNKQFRSAVGGVGPRRKDEWYSPFRNISHEVMREFGIVSTTIPVALCHTAIGEPVKFEGAPHPLRLRETEDGFEYVGGSQYWNFALMFDLRQSIPKQLVSARRWLETQKGLQELRGLKTIPRTQRDRNPNYRAMLRILDALEAGARPVYIAKRLYPKHESASDLVKAQRTEAERLRDGGYRFLPILGVKRERKTRR
jgi:hypothetical protein